jgi:hypothetical protein
VTRAAALILQGVSQRGAWLRGQPRMMAVALGAQARAPAGIKTANEIRKLATGDRPRRH